MMVRGPKHKPGGATLPLKERGHPTQATTIVIPLVKGRRDRAAFVPTTETRKKQTPTRVKRVKWAGTQTLLTLTRPTLPSGKRINALARNPLR